MERVINENEKIRRAEEIYNRRRDQTVRVPTNRVNKNNGNNKKPFSRIQKMILQICICILIYVSLYMVQNSNYIFSESVISKTKEILYYDINFPGLYNQFMDYIKGSKLFGGMEEDNETSGTQEDSNYINTTTNDVNEVSSEVNSSIDLNNAVGGGTSENVTLGESEVAKPVTDISSYNQMRIDAEAVKKNFTLQLPLKSYSISSEFGVRNVEPKFHTGEDLATPKGTAIYAAVDGTVILASSQGDYGNHLKIENGDLVTLYAHCSKLLVKEGAKIKKGQKIAEVGSTGNSTGPHLHFEIIYQGRLVNPEYVLKF